ncbi:glycosyltransferase family 39 protein [Lysobacter sp. Root690]|uniref:ArnT family glycosyltransferase n=1 Tax=Lysobacter sp. Root690 TaxID=1736588 RepID=UPI0006FB44FC|nr:glycosyltransferase family 39 protein [Lysobacter sp. Root690]KRB11488.1 dolichyl-phosphate-mannose-protein mannosyltransferase [Lysobacter sp. Root690]
MPITAFNRATQRHLWLFWVVASLVLVAGLGLRDPWPTDEPRFALVAKQMVDTGVWLFPHRGIELYSDKPPLFMWTQAVSYLLTGNWRVAFLLPSLLAALGTLWCVVDLGRRLWTPRVGLYAGWALLITVQFVFQGKKAQIDPSVVFWITLANYGLLRHLLTGPSWRWWAVGWFAAGIGTITKGVGVIALLMLAPVALAAVLRPVHGALAPGGVGARLLAWTRLPVRAGIGNPRFWLGPLAFLVAVSLWIVPMVAGVLSSGDPSHQAYLNDILFRQTAGRYSRSWDHHQPVWYHFGVMATMWLPTMFALPWAIPAWRRRLRRLDGRYLLPLVWWALVIVFFSIPAGKRDVYIMPALPMVCLALAPLLPGLMRRRALRVFAIAFAAALTLAALGVGLAMWFGDPGFERRLIVERQLTDGAHQLTVAVLAIGAWGTAALLWAGWKRPYHGLIATLAGLWVLYGLLIPPIFNDASSARGVMTRVAHTIGPDAELGLVGWRVQNMLMSPPGTKDFGYSVPWNQQLAMGLAWQAQSPQRRWLLIQEPAVPDCVDRSQAKVGVSNRRNWWLVPYSARVTCSAAPAISGIDKADLD